MCYFSETLFFGPVGAPCLTCDSSSATLAFALVDDCACAAAVAAVAVTGGGGTAVLAMNESRSFSWYTAARPGSPPSEMGRGALHKLTMIYRLVVEKLL